MTNQLIYSYLLSFTIYFDTHTLNYFKKGYTLFTFIKRFLALNKNIKV